MSKNSGKNLPKNIGEPKILTIPELLAPAGSPASAPHPSGRRCRHG